MNKHTMSITSKLQSRMAPNSVRGPRDEESTYTSAHKDLLWSVQACVESIFELLSAPGYKRCFEKSYTGDAQIRLRGYTKDISYCVQLVTVTHDGKELAKQTRRSKVTMIVKSFSKSVKYVETHWQTGCAHEQDENLSHEIKDVIYSCSVVHVTAVHAVRVPWIPGKGDYE